jgi:four helix bundle protein
MLVWILLIIWIEILKLKTMSFRQLIAWKKGFEVSMEIHQISKKFPIEERYSLTDQIRRSSRSVCANISEAYRKRRYPKHFISKLTDSDGENCETINWLEFAFACEYITRQQKNDLEQKCKEVGKLLNYMMNNPDKFK